MINKSYINMENRMQKGISFHQKGELKQAEQLYQQVLQDPKMPMLTIYWVLLPTKWGDTMWP